MGMTQERYFSGNGIYSISSPGTLPKWPAAHSAFACSMRSLRDDTKFHQMCRGPSIGAPPTMTKWVSVTAVIQLGSIVAVIAYFRLDLAEVLRGVARAIREAAYVAQVGRPGPVLVDIPRDVFQARTEFSYPEKVDLPGFKPKLFGHPAQVKKAG